MKTHYILIDFENVQPRFIDEVDAEHFRLLVFVGSTQSRLPYDVASAMQKLGERAQYIKISGIGPNALDFHIAFYIGRIAALDPQACFHIVSHDRGFDPLIAHLKELGIAADRVEAVADIHFIASGAADKTRERADAVWQRLAGNGTRPRTVRTLASSIAAQFQKSLDDAELAAIIELLVNDGRITINGTRLSYALP
ncbi:hypothetical protein GCM10007205_05630 [Oxalicibacterium flavum]|uniref:PIN-like domain-containing protein n=1 Tax=Oxalicibacterium flavum TaxID=179467 RepID=A0A8J2UJS9_9BURK|nr:PIN domain-containing protein [Oxalicibacterium flavum]GGB99191.1 hypothetical protein GCM10007205_05630 [Oxalicibacterium flavum]